MMGGYKNMETAYKKYTMTRTAKVERLGEDQTREDLLREKNQVRFPTLIPEKWVA